MDNENRTAQQQTEGQVVPHTGQLEGNLQELPKKRFNKPLNRAYSEGLIETPEDARKLKPWYKRTVTYIGAGAVVVAAGALTVGGMLIPKGDDAKNSGPDKDPKATSQPTSTPEATPTQAPEKELSVASIEIPANLSPEQTGEAIIDRLSEWNMAGATIENQAVYLGGDTALPTTLAGQNAELFTQALFTEGPKDDNTQKVIAYQTNSNASNIEDWFKTYHADEDSKATFPQDTEPYTRTMEVDPNGVTATPNADTTSFSITVTEHEDLKNRIGDPTSNIYESTPVEGNKFIANATTKVIDGKVKIVSIEFVNP